MMRGSLERSGSWQEDESSEDSSLEESVEAAEPRECLSPQRSGIVLRLPEYDRYSRAYPIHLRDFTKYDSLVNAGQRQIEIAPLLAWGLLLANMVATAMVPCWLMSDLKYEGLTQNSWRFLTVALLAVPLVAYERRQVAAVGGSLLSQLQPDMLKRNFMSSISVCIWFLIVKYAVKLTSMLHTFSLMTLQPFALLLRRRANNQSHHEFQSAGLLLVSTGLLCTVYDSATGPVEAGKPNQIYLSYSNLSRICGDVLSLAGSFISVYFSERFVAPSEPRFLNVFVLNFFIGFNFIWFGYFFGGSELSFDEFYGVFGVLSKQNFPSMFYIGIMLGFNLVMGSILLNQIFSRVIIRISNCFTILIMAVLCHLLDIERADLALTSLSFGFIVPGLIFIITGESLMENSEVKINFVLYRPQERGSQREMEVEMVEMRRNEVERRTGHSA